MASDREIGPRVTIELAYDQALRLSYMATFPADALRGDDEVAREVNLAIQRAEGTYDAAA